MDVRTPPFLRLDEVLDTARVGDPWEGFDRRSWIQGEREARTVNGSRVRSEPQVDVALNLGRSGAVASVHLQGLTVDSTTARGVVEAVTVAVRTPGSLIEPVFLRIRSTPDPRSPLRLIPALWCMPHIAHEGRAPEWDEGVHVQVGRRRWTQSAQNGGNAIGVRVHIAASGRVDRLEFLGGNEALLPNVREFLESKTIDPALRNGQPEAGHLHLVFTGVSG